MIALIAAIAENNVIGRNNALPWHCPADLAFFRKKTQGKVVIMGRKTFESLDSKPLPKRFNIVLSSQQISVAQFEGAVAVAHSVQEALSLAQDNNPQQAEIMVIGGAQIYELFMPVASRLYLSRILQKVDGDTFFPVVNWSEWIRLSTETHPSFIAETFSRIGV